MLGVAENTVRNDLDALQREGKLVRSHGGAMLKEEGLPAPPYSQVRDQHQLEKSWIGLAAAHFLPDTGSVFINAGSTTYQLALNIREHQIDVATNSPEIAVYLTGSRSVPVDLIGGRMLKESMETDGAWSCDYLDRLYWDVVFYGVTAIDSEHGITSVSLAIAEFETKVAQHGSKVVGLCDSSKFGRFARAQVGPVGLLDVLVTDINVKPAVVEMLRAEGIEVVVAGPQT
jgi:DeoR/GlpR family transcriptional regulator of sugar metabolism